MTESMKPHRYGRFTLVELLVVIAIIAVLCSLLLPALSQAKERSRQAVCLGNLKQVAICVVSYVNDNDENYFYLAESSAAAVANWTWWPTLLAPYYETREFMTCPSHGAQGWDKNQYAPGQSYGVNYGWNNKAGFPYSISGGTVYKTRTVKDIRRPSEILAITENQATYSIYNPNLWVMNVDSDGDGTLDTNAACWDDGAASYECVYNQGAPARHTRGCQVLFFDGHVQRVDIRSWVKKELWDCSQ